MIVSDCYWCSNSFTKSDRTAVHCLIQQSNGLWAKKIFICQKDLWELISREIDPESLGSPYFKIEIKSVFGQKENICSPIGLELFKDEDPVKLNTDYILRDIFVYERPLIPPTSEQIKEFRF